MILFIGAGVSKLFGIPDTKGFIEVFDKQPNISQTAIYMKMKETFADDVDLEVLMTVTEDLSKPYDILVRSISPQTTQFIIINDLKRNRLRQLRKEARSLLKDMKSIIRSECMKSESRSQDDILDTYDPFLGTLSSSSPIHTSEDGRVRYPNMLKIITTNYDRCIEIYLRRRQIPFAQGLAQKYGDTVFDVSSFDDKGNRVGLFKLHGSIDLFDINGILRRKIYDEEIGEEVVYYPVEFSGYQHVIESPYLELFYLFRDRINRDNIWIIIGSSLRDRTICSIMNDVIRLKPEGQQPRVVFVNPDDTVVKRLGEWGFIYLRDRIRHVKEYFGSKETNEMIMISLQQNP